MKQRTKDYLCYLIVHCSLLWINCGGYFMPRYKFVCTLLYHLNKREKRKGIK